MRVNTTVCVVLASSPVPWRDLALCRETDPEAFFPQRSTEAASAPAKRICGRCDVRAECLRDALDHDEQAGILGGLTAAERRNLKQRAA